MITRGQVRRDQKILRAETPEEAVALAKEYGPMLPADVTDAWIILNDLDGRPVEAAQRPVVSGLKVDLRNRKLEKINFGPAGGRGYVFDLSGATLVGCDFSRLNLASWDFSASTLTDCALQGTRADGANWRGATGKNCTGLTEQHIALLGRR